jgi:hypothetical protein
METNKVVRILQTLKYSAKDVYALAEKYYFILSTVNDLKLTPREIQLVAFTAIKGNISYNNIRKEFCNKHNTTIPTINNIIFKLKKIGVLVKMGEKVRVNPVILLNFEKDVTLEIKLIHG